MPTRPLRRNQVSSTDNRFSWLDQLKLVKAFVHNRWQLLTGGTQMAGPIRRSRVDSRRGQSSTEKQMCDGSKSICSLRHASTRFADKFNSTGGDPLALSESRRQAVRKRASISCGGIDRPVDVRSAAGGRVECLKTSNKCSEALPDTANLTLRIGRICGTVVHWGKTGKVKRPSRCGPESYQSPDDVNGRGRDRRGRRRRCRRRHRHSLTD